MVFGFIGSALLQVQFHSSVMGTASWLLIFCTYEKDQGPRAKIKEIVARARVFGGLN